MQEHLDLEVSGPTQESEVDDSLINPFLAITTNHRVLHNYVSRDGPDPP